MYQPSVTAFRNHVFSPARTAPTAQPPKLRPTTHAQHIFVVLLVYLQPLYARTELTISCQNAFDILPFSIWAKIFFYHFLLSYLSAIDCTRLVLCPVECKGYYIESGILSRRHQPR